MKLLLDTNNSVALAFPHHCEIEGCAKQAKYIVRASYFDELDFSICTHHYKQFKNVEKLVIQEG